MRESSESGGEGEIRGAVLATRRRGRRTRPHTAREPATGGSCRPMWAPLPRGLDGQSGASAHQQNCFWSRRVTRRGRARCDGRMMRGRPPSSLPKRRDRLRGGSNGEGASGREACDWCILLAVYLQLVFLSSHSSNNTSHTTMPVLLADTRPQYTSRHLFTTSPSISRLDAHSGFVKGDKVPPHTAVSRICRPDVTRTALCPPSPRSRAGRH